MIVADTSLIAALILNTTSTAVAEAVLLRDSEWTAPALWRYEFKNVLSTQIRVLRLPLDQAVAYFDKAEELIRPAQIEVSPESILRLAQAKKLTAYDAEFLALALALEVKIVTSDREILKAAPDFAISPDDFQSSPV